MNGMTSPVIMYLNGLPYAPLMGLLLAPFTYTQAEAVLTAQILQVIFYPLGMLLIMLLVRKYLGTKTALLTGLLLAGSCYAYWQSQVRPQSLEMLFYPLAFYSVLEGKTKTFILATALMFYTHSPISLALCLGFWVYLFHKNRYDKKLWLSIAACVPISLYQLAYMFSMNIMNRWVVHGDLGIYVETQLFLASPLVWLAMYAGLNLLAIPSIPFLAKRWNQTSEFLHLLVYSMVGMMIIFPIWYQRTLSYILVPFAVIVAYQAGKLKPWLKPLFYMALLFQFAVWAALPHWWVAPLQNFNGWW
jgi:hypothetical protein